MTQKKVLRYHLKKDVRRDLLYLFNEFDYLLRHDAIDGFECIPPYSILPSLFKVFSHLLWNRNFETWFKKVYE